jgi:hypothetical protein
MIKESLKCNSSFSHLLGDIELKNEKIIAHSNQNAEKYFELNPEDISGIINYLLRDRSDSYTLQIIDFLSNELLESLEAFYAQQFI